MKKTGKGKHLMCPNCKNNHPSPVGKCLVCGYDYLAPLPTPPIPKEWEKFKKIIVTIADIVHTHPNNFEDCLEYQHGIKLIRTLLTQKEQEVAGKFLAIGKRYTDNRKFRKTDNFVILGRRLDALVDSLTHQEKGKPTDHTKPNNFGDFPNESPLPKQEGFVRQFIQRIIKFSTEQVRMGRNYGWSEETLTKELEDFIASELSTAHQQGYAEGKRYAKEMIDCEIDCIKNGNALTPTEQDVAIKACKAVEHRMGIDTMSEHDREMINEGYQRSDRDTRRGE